MIEPLLIVRFAQVRPLCMLYDILDTTTCYFLEFSTLIVRNICKLRETCNVNVNINMSISGTLESIYCYSKQLYDGNSLTAVECRCSVAIRWQNVMHTKLQ